MKSALPAQKDGPRINEEIRSKEVQLIDSTGDNKGVVDTQAALGMAEAAGLDSGRDFSQFHPARLQNPGFRQVQIPGAEESGRSPQKAEGRRDQGDQAPADDRRSRLRREDALDEALLRRRRQGQDHLALPRPRNGAPGARLQAAQPRQGRHRARSPRSNRSRASKAGRWSCCWRRAKRRRLSTINSAARSSRAAFCVSRQAQRFSASQRPAQLAPPPAPCQVPEPASPDRWPVPLAPLSPSRMLTLTAPCRELTVPETLALAVARIADLAVRHGQADSGRLGRNRPFR